MKKYALVRVDKFCPRALERNYNLKCIGSLHCDKCDLKKKYGDTKEQLVRKVAQAIRTQIKKNYIDVNVGKIGYFIRAEELAKEIVEFLGVEE